MSITFTPRWAAILICDFERSYVEPEMCKVRRVIVLSSTQYNTWRAHAPGTCTVVPISATAPWGDDPRSVFIPRGSYGSLTCDVWAKCAAVSTVSNARLSRVRLGSRYLGEYASQADMVRIQTAARLALSL